MMPHPLRFDDIDSIETVRDARLLVGELIAYHCACSSRLYPARAMAVLGLETLRMKAATGDVLAYLDAARDYIADGL